MHFFNWIRRILSLRSALRGSLLQAACMPGSPLGIEGSILVGDWVSCCCPTWSFWHATRAIDWRCLSILLTDRFWCRNFIYSLLLTSRIFATWSKFDGLSCSSGANDVVHDIVFDALQAQVIITTSLLLLHISHRLRLLIHHDFVDRSCTRIPVNFDFCGASYSWTCIISWVVATSLLGLVDLLLGGAHRKAHLRG